MKRFAMLVLSICTTLTVLTAGASSRGVHLLRPVTFQTLGFRLCEQTPCFLEIVPGETSWTEALAMLRPYPQIKFTNTFGVIFDGETVLADSYSRPPRSLDVITVWSPAISPSIGSAIQEFGIPCGLSFYPMVSNQCTPPGTCSGLYSMEIRYESLILQVSLRVDSAYPRQIEITRLDPTLPVRSLALVNPARYQGTATPFCHISPTMDDRVAPGVARIDTPWLGFASTRRYLDYAVRLGT